MKKKSAKQNSILFNAPAAKLENAEGNADSNEKPITGIYKLSDWNQAQKKKLLSKNESRFYTFT